MLFIPCRATCRCAAIVAIALSLVSPSAAQRDWPMYQHDAAHSGYIPIQIGFQTAVQRWSVNPPVSSRSHITTGSGKLFLNTADKKLLALDAATGVELWRQDFQTAAYINPPSYADGKVYIQTVNHGSDTYLRCYDADTGQLVFQSAHSAQWSQYLAPTIHDGKVYVNGGYYGGMYAFDGVTGARLWFLALAQYDEWTPAVAGDVAYAYVGGSVAAVNRHTGTLQYEIVDPNFQWAGWSMDLAPVLGGRDDLFVIHGGRLLRFDLPNRRIAYDLTGNFRGQPAVKDGVVYAISSGTLQARDQADGSLLWSWGDPGHLLRDEVALTIGHAFVRSSSATFAIDLATHQDVWTHPAAGNMTITQGAIYLAESNGFVTAIGFAPQPVPLSVEPSYHPYVQGPREVTVRGSGFMVDPTGLSVRFGVTPATNVVVVDDQTLRCTMPVTSPGVLDVVLENQFGRGTLEAGFAVTPAVAVGDLPRPNDRLRIDYHQRPQDQMLALIGFGPPQSYARPPLQGSLCLPPNQMIGFLYLTAWVEPVFRTSLVVPDNPSLSGTAVLLQSVAGPDLWHYNGAFSNCIAFRIQ